MRTIRRLCVLVVVATAACSGGAPTSSPSPARLALPRPTPTPPTPAPTPAPLAAPALIQVENSGFARPQSGLAGADVVYEYVAEGGISRFSALYLHPPAGLVGPIRSARLVTVKLTAQYGAVLLYAGAGTYVQRLLNQSGVPKFDEDSGNGDLFRIRTRAPPHNLYADNASVGDLLQRAGAPTVPWQLWSRSLVSPAWGIPATGFRVPISYAEEPSWRFDPTGGDYLRDEPDSGPFIDATSGRRVAAATVIVQQVDITYSSQVVDVNGVHGVDHDIRSGGVAQIFTGGRELDATWSQPASGPPVYTLRGGIPAPVAPGLVWIELVATGSPAVIG